MSLTIEHLLSEPSWQEVLRQFGSRYGVIKVFIDERGEEDNFPFTDLSLDAKEISQDGLQFIRSTLVDLDGRLNIDFEVVNTPASHA